MRVSREMTPVVFSVSTAAWMYVDRNVNMSASAEGTTGEEDGIILSYRVAVDMKLKAGWNTVVASILIGEVWVVNVTTAPVPSNAFWSISSADDDEEE